jgi:act minimal PKS chain-length factor (CLF/KS beta)
MSTSTVVTGLGVAAPNGLGLHDYWQATLAGRSGIQRIERFDPSPYPVRLAGVVREFIVEDHLPSRLITQTDRVTQLALVCADWALTDAGVRSSELSEFEMGVVTASSCGGFEFGERELRRLWGQGPEYVSAYQSFAWFYAVNTGQISIRHGIRGASGVVVSDQAGGLDAIAQGRRTIRRGSKLVVSGGMDAPICPWGWAAQLTSGRLSENEDPERAFRPFDPAADGHVVGEGGALLILEDARSARARGARPYGMIAGYGATFDPKPSAGREPALARAIQLALQDAGMAATDVDVVFADAAALPALDRIEAEAIASTFGPRRVPVTAPKTMYGRLCAGAGSLDVAAALMAIRDGIIPPTCNVSPLPQYELDLVLGAPRRASLRAALVLARGYGGFNSALIVRSCD